MRAFIAGLMVFAALVGPSRATATPGCRTYSYLPALKPLILVHSTGMTVALRRANSYRPSVSVAVNGAYVGDEAIPFSLAGGEIQVRLLLQHRLETWQGSVRQTIKPVPSVLVCGSWVPAAR